MSGKKVIVIGSGAAALFLASALLPANNVTVITKKSKKTAILHLPKEASPLLIWKEIRLQLIPKILCMPDAAIMMEN